MSLIKNTLRFLGNRWPLQFKVSFSQEGEDLILRRIFGNKNDGFFIDVGAHHPFRLSNTYHFYRLGWHGINIDPMPGIKRIFEKTRPRDINIEVGVGLSSKLLTYYQFNEPALNTFSEEEVKKKVGNTYWVIKKNKIQVLSMSEILEKYLPKGQVIDFMSIDVEGLDEEVIKSNDWVKFRPNYLILEILDAKLTSIDKNKTYQYICNQGYCLEYKTYNSFIFKSINIKC